jgi:hypothetical protein
MFKLFVVVIALFHSIVAFGVEWKIERVDIFDEQTQKTKTHSNCQGSVFIDLRNKFVVFPSIYEAGIWSFNSCDANIFNSEIFGTYTLKNHSLPQTDKIVVITFSDSKSFEGYIGKVVVHNKNLTKTFYLSRDESEISAADYLPILKEMFENIKFDWVYVCESSEGDLYFFKSESVKTSSSAYVKVWTKKYLRTYKYKGVIYKNVEVKTLMTFDCDNTQVSAEDEIYYTSNGKIINSETGSTGWVNVPPESLGETLLNTACELFKK